MYVMCRECVRGLNHVCARVCVRVTDKFSLSKIVALKSDDSDLRVRRLLNGQSMWLTSVRIFLRYETDLKFISNSAGFKTKNVL